MAKKKFVLNKKGLTELMKSSEMRSIQNDAAAKIAAAAANISGVPADGYVIEPAHPITFVGIGAVHASSAAARRDNDKNNTLQKAAGSVKI